MRLYQEKPLRKQSDEPMLAMLDLWHFLAEQTVGVCIEVMIRNRRENLTRETAYSNNFDFSCFQVSASSLVYWCINYRMFHYFKNFLLNLYNVCPHNFPQVEVQQDQLTQF